MLLLLLCLLPSPPLAPSPCPPGQHLSMSSQAETAMQDLQAAVEALLNTSC
jgi:hypothetical protein